MLGRYIDWDRTTIELLRHHEEDAIALANLREEYAALTDGLGAVDYSRDRVSASSVSDDSVVNQYIHKAVIEERIKTLSQETRRYDRAWQALDEEERRILAEFFQRGRRRSQEAVDELCGIYGFERTKIYEMRRETIRKFKRLLFG